MGSYRGMLKLTPVLACFFASIGWADNVAACEYQIES
jgi:hypothetical protein